MTQRSAALHSATPRPGALHHVSFDLDGTLVDSARLIATLCNVMLADRRSARRVTADDARPLVSLGAEEVVGGLVGADGGLDAAVAEFRHRYADAPTPADILYPGVRDGLAALRRAGLSLSLCTNKPQALAEKTLADLDLAHHFAAIVGSAPALQRKPAPDMLRVALAASGAAPSEALLVGDSSVDARLAEVVGCVFLFVSYGYAEQGWVHPSSAPRAADFDGVVETVMRLAGRNAA